MGGPFVTLPLNAAIFSPSYGRIWFTPISISRDALPSGVKLQTFRRIDSAASSITRPLEAALAAIMRRIRETQARPDS
jgi:hypothetical protein